MKLSLENFYTAIGLEMHLCKQKKFLLAISGGVDSMVLAHLFLSAKLSFEVAHVNYHLRDEDANKDEELVAQFCKKNNIQFHLLDAYKNEKKGSIQLWARTIRYDYFRKIMSDNHLDFLVTAHHLNDQLETFLINLSRASGIEGLSGIPHSEKNLLRPLLGFSKSALLSYAKEHCVEFREDLSNKKNDYLRNKFRNKVISTIEEVEPNFLNQFKKSIFYLSEAKQFILDEIENKIKKIATETEEGFILNKNEFAKESPFVQFEILKKHGFVHREEIIKIGQATTGSLFFSKENQIVIDKNNLIITKILKKENKIQKNTLGLDITLDEMGNLIIDLSQYVEKPNKETRIWEFDADMICFPLYLRHKKEGDSFYPIGLNKKKKVSKFFIDEKMSILAKQKTWLLADHNDTILGIIPNRQDARYSATQLTKRKLIIKYLKNNEI